MLAGALGCLALLSACERPFVAPTAPDIRVVAPDLSIILSASLVLIEVEANSFRAVEQVEINGKPLTFDPGRNLWQREVPLQEGLNTLLIVATDVAGTERVDTAYAVRMPFQFQVAPALPSPRGGHTATLLLDGSVLVVGGASRAGGPALPDAFLLPPGAGAFQRISGGLHTARTGHTATLLPDGRVLIAGGSRTDALNAVEDLVETVEIYNPVFRRFDALPFGGQPIRRALHTASLRSATLLDLYGGRGDIRYEPDPRLGTRRDLRTFRITPDSLVALNTLRSAPDLEAAIAGHSQTPLTSLAPGQAGRYLVAGTFFDGPVADDVSFKVDFTRPPQIFISETPPPFLSRTRHAAVRFRDGFIGIFGGTRTTPEEALGEPELYVEQARRYFRFPVVQPPLKRYAHTATKLPSQRILLVGGFSLDGNSVIGSEFFDSDFLNEGF